MLAAHSIAASSRRALPATALGSPQWKVNGLKIAIRPKMPSPKPSILRLDSVSPRKMAAPIGAHNTLV